MTASTAINSRYFYSSVMIIDDSHPDMFILEKVLTIKNFAEKITKFYNAIDALDHLKQQNITLPEIIFLDINMPELNGFQFLERLQLNLPHLVDKIKIIILTSSDDNQDVNRARDFNNISKYLLKPISSENLESLKALK